MDKKVYIWLFRNIGKYEFEGERANQIKSSISRMLITEDSINSGAMLSKIQELYSEFCGLFYNNILGYKNGLADNSITSQELDCYFIQTSDGLIPIGYYRSIRPAETASMVQKYLDECKTGLDTERNQIVVKWQSKLDLISANYEKIKNSPNPNAVKAILGLVLSIVIFILSAVSLVKLNVISVLFNWGDGTVLEQALERIPFIANGTQNSWIGYLIFVIIAIIAAVFGVIFSSKEYKLISAKRTTKEILSNMLMYVNKLEQGMANAPEQAYFELYDAARKGDNAKVEKNANSGIVTDVSKRLETANTFTEKSEGQRAGISYIVIALLLIVILLLSLSYSKGIAHSIHATNNNQTQQSSYQNSSNQSAMQNADVTTEEKKVSSYAVYKSDVTWEEANQYARNSGGYLVCINDSEEFDLVCKMADEKNIKVFWVGAKRGDYSDWSDVRWLDGEDITYTHWLSGEPTYYDEEGVSENYLMVFKVSGTWYFNDAVEDVSQYYSGKIGYIVEFEE